MDNYERTEQLSYEVQQNLDSLTTLIIYFIIL